MRSFDHRRLDVYATSIDVMRKISAVLPRIPRQTWPLGDQLLRAASSIPLNIAEGAGEFSRRDKARYYRIARRSAAECSAILDVLEAMAIIEASSLQALDIDLDRIGAMLTALVRSLEARNVVPEPQPQPEPEPDRNAKGTRE